MNKCIFSSQIRC